MIKKQNKKINVAINGFGRIGRAVFKIAFEKDNFEIVAINDLTNNVTLAHLLKYDSVYGIYNKDVKSDKNSLYINNKKYPVYEITEPKNLPWGKLKVDVVLECTGRFVKDGSFNAHLNAGAKKVILSAPSKGKPEIPIYIMGVNNDKYKNEKVISNASCTTNSIAPISDIIDKNFKIKQAFLTTIHSYTSDQNLIDGPHKDLRRARAATNNIIPTTTGATVATTKVLPRLKNKFNGIAVRVPTICGSLSDLTFVVSKKTTAENVNKILKNASKTLKLKNILSVTNEPIVSSDIIGNPYSSIVDLSLTQVVENNLIKILTWYDNEWGYSNRMVEMIEIVT